MMRLKTKTKTRKNMKAGAVLGSGGFGCIFRPSLKCVNKKTRKNSANEISKLMLKKNAKIEYTEINKFKKQLNTIPNYLDYFLLDGFSLCEPGELNKEDLSNFNKKCNALKKKGIKESNINQNLKKLMSINMPFGGIDVGDYVEQVNADYTKMKALNKKLIDLLKNGIIPMNKHHVFHCDIKESNVLIEGDSNHARLIDWGLSTTFNPMVNKSIPKANRRRPFQFNTPFSTILFQDSFDELYGTFLKQNPNPSFILIRSFVINYVLFVIEKRGPGHLRNINSIMKHFFMDHLMMVEEKFKEDIIEFEYTVYFIFEYLSKILFKYTRNNKFDGYAYFKEVFVKNVDIWGFIMVYMPIKEYLLDNFKTISKTDEDIIAIIKKVYIMAVEAAVEPIDTEKIISELEKLNELFSKKVQGRTSINSDSSVESSSSSKQTKLYKTKTKTMSKKHSAKSSGKTRKISSVTKSQSPLTTFLKFLSTSKK